MKKLKLKTFSNWVKKTKVHVGDKVIELRKERGLLRRFLIIQGSQPELLPRLKETSVSTRWQWCHVPYAQLMDLFIFQLTKPA